MFVIFRWHMTLATSPVEGEILAVKVCFHLAPLEKLRFETILLLLFRNARKHSSYQILCLPSIRWGSFTECLVGSRERNIVFFNPHLTWILDWHGGGGVPCPVPQISGTDRSIYRILTAYDRPGNFVEGSTLFWLSFFHHTNLSVIRTFDFIQLYNVVRFKFPLCVGEFCTRQSIF